MILSKPQQLIAYDNSRFKVVCAGRRFGKTYLSIRELCYRARMPNKEIFYITSSYRAAKMIVWKPLKQRLLDLRWVKKINESELSITLVNGSTISLKGAENKDSLRGVSLYYCVIDEAADCDPDLFPEIIRPALADQLGGALFIGTPKGTSNYFFDLYQAAQSLKDWKTWSYTTLEGGRVIASEIEAARADMSEKQFNQEFLATFESTANRIAWAFDRTVNVKDIQAPDTRIIYVGMDFNVNPICATIGVKTNEDIMHIIDEVEIFGSDTNEIAQEIKFRYPSSKVFVFPDPSGSRRQTSSSGKSDHIILEEAGFIVKAPRKHDPVRDRINALNARLKNANGTVNLYIAANCKKTISSLEKHAYKAGTQIPDKDSGHDHQFDALSYKIAFLWPIKKPAPAYTPQTWGARIQ
jgi:hypothetical protein